jgi:enoyl-CoA hydratase
VSADGEIGLTTPAPGVALIVVERAPKLNTLSAGTLEELDRIVRSVARAPHVRAVVVAGAGGHAFAAGADLREVASLSPSSALAFAARGQRVFDALERMPRPVFAAIDGFCMGGGLDLALACDVRIASRSSVFAHPGARLGILTGFGGTQRLARLIGQSRALDLFVTARRVDADEALAMGLVDRLADDPVAASVEAATAIVGNARAGAIKTEAIRAWRGCW